MGLLMSCCGGTPSSYSDIDQPSNPEERRRQMAEAAELRLKTQEGRGVKDPSALKQRQKRLEELERKQETASSQEGNLRWQVN
ncbi:hypothetical protein SK128_026484 [Halocaridina rubra]|uniref:Small VCP/p97-interacting protein n=1 Tax=Halocaridina rubra TaxID=373956 RepID=A0AAN9AAK3_HALRR